MKRPGQPPTDRADAASSKALRFHWGAVCLCPTFRQTSQSAGSAVGYAGFIFVVLDGVLDDFDKVAHRMTRTGRCISKVGVRNPSCSGQVIEPREGRAKHGNTRCGL